MWRLENTAELPRDADPDAVGVSSPAPETQFTSPDRVTAAELGDPALQLVDPTESARRVWREEIAALGGPSPLLHFEDSPRARIDLTSTHPGGLARFIAGKRTRLSSLVRESFAARTAQLAAEAILQKSSELSSARGIDAIRLGIVVAEWDAPRRLSDGTELTEHFVAPVLLRTARMRRVGDDFELVLRGTTELNPAFAAVLAQQFGIVLDPATFVGLASVNGAFTPNAVLDGLRQLTAHLPGFSVTPRLVITSFAEVAGPMLADAALLAHPVLDAIAGNQAAVETIRETWRAATPVPVDQRSPQTDDLLLDADDEQERVIAQIAAGNSMVVRTLPGAGGTQTIVNALGALVNEGKRVLVVGPRRESLRAVRDRLDALGLTGLTASPSTARRDTILAISRAEQAKRPELAEVDDALVRLRSVIKDYREALIRPDPVLGVTVLDCVSELSRLAIAAPQAMTTARLTRQAVEQLAAAPARARIAEAAQQAARLGEFRRAPGSNPWLGARFTSAADAARAHELALKLHQWTMPDLMTKGLALIEGTHMRAFQNVHELGIYIRLLLDLRDTLDRFQPTVFDRSITELIAATAPKREHPEFSNAERRSLIKHAQDYLRPGVRVPDLHDALVRVQKQRVLWHRYVAEGAVPRVPVGIAECQVALQAVEQDLVELDTWLGRTEGTRLSRLPIAELRTLLAALAEESEALHSLQERSELLGQLHAAGLDPLIADFAARGVPVEHMPDELELAWWKSALIGMLETERALLGAKTEVLDRLEADFRLVDEAHARGNAAGLAWRLAEQWRIGLVDWREEAELLKRVLRKPQVDSTDLYRAAPHLTRALTPIWLASPYDMPRIDPTMPFDAVLLLDAGAMTVAEAALAVRRGRQVVAFGDPVTQTPSPFATRVEDQRGAAAHAESSPAAAPESIFDVLARLLRVATLTRSYRAGGEDLAELVNRRFYGGRIIAQPWAGTYLGHATLKVDLVQGARGQLNEQASAAESPDAEVARVVDLVLAHAARRPTESLMVVTPSRRHAVRVMSAVLEASVRRPELAAFLTRETWEPFDCVALDHSVASSRDRVIFSLGYGRTAHGRVLTDFGPLSGPGGERLLASALTSARRACRIVTSVGIDDLDPSRIPAGIMAFREVLEDIAQSIPPADREVDGDPMIIDLAERLGARGVTTRLGYRGALPLVASFGGRAAAIETDTDLLSASLRESLRMRPELLKRLGWHYVRVHAFELFQMPDAIADRIAELLNVPAGSPPVPGPRRATYVAPSITPSEVPPALPVSEGELVGEAIAPLEALGASIVDAQVEVETAAQAELEVDVEVSVTLASDREEPPTPFVVSELRPVEPAVTTPIVAHGGSFWGEETDAVIPAFLPSAPPAADAAGRSDQGSAPSSNFAPQPVAAAAPPEPAPVVAEPEQPVDAPRAFEMHQSAEQAFVTRGGLHPTSELPPLTDADAALPSTEPITLPGLEGDFT